MPRVNMPELNPKVESMAIRTQHVYLPLTLRNVRNDIGCPLMMASDAQQQIFW